MVLLAASIGSISQHLGIYQHCHGFLGSIYGFYLTKSSYLLALFKVLLAASIDSILQHLGYIRTVQGSMNSSDHACDRPSCLNWTPLWSLHCKIGRSEVQTYELKTASHKSNFWIQVYVVTSWVILLKRKSYWFCFEYIFCKSNHVLVFSLFFFFNYCYFGYMCCSAKGEGMQYCFNYCFFCYLCCSVGGRAQSCFNYCSFGYSCCSTGGGGVTSCFNY